MLGKFNNLAPAMAVAMIAATSEAVLDFEPASFEASSAAARPWFAFSAASPAVFVASEAFVSPSWAVVKLFCASVTPALASVRPFCAAAIAASLLPFFAV